MTKNVLVLMVLGVSLVGCGGGSKTPEEAAHQAYKETVVQVSFLPYLSEEGHRLRLSKYVRFAQRVQSREGDFSGLTTEQVKYFKGLASVNAEREALALYRRYLTRLELYPDSLLMMGETEETFYWLWQAKQVVGLSCEDSRWNCDADSFQANGSHAAMMMITNSGGLLERMRADPKGYEAAKKIHHLIMRWDMWKDLTMTDAERMRIATSMVGDR